MKEPTARTPELTARAGTYATFSLGGQAYALEAGRICEITGLPFVTPLPQTPEHVRGVISRRGTPIPVIDLGIKLGLTPVKQTPHTCIIVVAFDSMRVGLMVDDMAAAVDVAETEIRPAGPEACAHISGVAQREERTVHLVDIDGLLCSDDFTWARELQEMEPAEQPSASRNAPEGGPGPALPSRHRRSP